MSGTAQAQVVDLSALALLDMDDLRKVLKCSKSKADEIRRSGYVEVTMISRLVRFTPEAVKAYIASQAGQQQDDDLP